MKIRSIAILLFIMCVCFVMYLEEFSPIYACPQTSDQQSNIATINVQRVMTESFSRCFSSMNGIQVISWKPPTADEMATVKSFGDLAVPPLRDYLTTKKGGIRQLLAVKFLSAIGTTSAFIALEQGLTSDQWEVTRAQALASMYAISPAETQPYLKKALNDSSQLVRKRASDLLLLDMPKSVQKNTY